MLLSPIDVSKKAEMITLWNKAMGKNFPIYDQLFMQNTFNDPHLYSDASQMMINSSGEITGFILCKKGVQAPTLDISDQNGFIQSIVVDPAQQSKKIAKHLLETAEQAFKQSNAKKIIVGQDFNHYFPGVPTSATNAISFFETNGYQKKDIQTDLIQKETEKYTIKKGKNINVSLLTLDKKEAFLQFLENHFPGRWAYEAHFYFQNGGTGREYIIMEKENIIIGFCRINDDTSPIIGPNVYWKQLFNHPIGGIGPLGIKKAERKNGYGLQIVAEGMNYLIERKIQTIIIDWTTHIHFYQKLGFKPWKQYQTFEKNIQ